jgi:hypothetical protein
LKLNLGEVCSVIYKAGAKVVFVAEMCQRGNFTKAPRLTFQTYNKNKNSINRTLQKLFGDNFVKFKDISFADDFDKDLECLLHTHRK